MLLDGSADGAHANLLFDGTFVDDSSDEIEGQRGQWLRNRLVGLLMGMRVNVVVAHRGR